MGCRELARDQYHSMKSNPDHNDVKGPPRIAHNPNLVGSALSRLRSPCGLGEDLVSSPGNLYFPRRDPIRIVLEIACPVPTSWPLGDHLRWLAVLPVCCSCSPCFPGRLLPRTN